MKAFIVQEPDELTGGVVYARRDIEARKRGAQAYAGTDEIGGMICRRCPALDDKRGDPRAQTRVLLEMGWWFDNERLSVDDNPFVAMNGEVYRTWMEWLDGRVRAARHQKRRADTLRRAALDLWGRWWFADAIDVWADGDDHYTATITVPYLRDGVRYRSREHMHSVTVRDLSAFRAAYTVNRDSVPVAPDGRLYA